MRRRRLLLLLAPLVLSTLVLAHGARRLGRANARAASAASQLEEARAKGRELLTLRSHRELVAESERPPQDVIAQINAALAEVGIRSDSLKEFEPVADVSLGRPGDQSGRYRRQGVSATFENLTPLDIGRFLAEWRGRQPVWVPTRLELYHVRDQPRPELLYSMRAVFTALYLADATAEDTR